MTANPAQVIVSCEAIAEPSLRDVARMNIHRVRTQSADGEGYVWLPGGETRWAALGELLDRLAKEHQIDDRVGLENAVDAAALIYDHRPKDVDVKRLKCLLEGVKAFMDEDDRAIAHILMDRDRSLVAGEAWDHQAAMAVWTRVLMIRELFSDPEIRKFFSDLERALRKQPPTRKPDMRLHGMVAALARYWESLPGKKLTTTFTKRDQRAGRQLGSSAGMQFIESVVEFIDPDAVKKLPSATRHRLS